MYMLLIGDLHVTQRSISPLLVQIDQFLSTHPDDKQIIFVGDYVYHFSYHKETLLTLFEYFLDLYRRGYHVRVLAGNHDRLGQHFVYAEGQKTLQTIIDEETIGSLGGSVSGNDQTGSLTLITEPLMAYIDGRPILFFPYMIDQTPHEIVSSTPDHPLVYEATQLMQSSQQAERVSGYRNLQLWDSMQQHTGTEELTIIHHYYIAQTVLPGQQTQFRYRDIALSPQWLTMPGVRLLSGHIHQSASRDNYLCLGSVRYTSPHESNHAKYLWHRDTTSDTVTAQQVFINPLVDCDSATMQSWTSPEAIQTHISDMIAQREGSIWQSSTWNIRVQAQPRTTTQRRLRLHTSDAEQTIATNIQEQLSAVDIVHHQRQADDLLTPLTLDTDTLRNSRYNRKELLDVHLTRKFPDTAERYREYLRGIGLI